MPKCPHCGSTAQVKIIDVNIDLEEDEKVYIRRYYKCGCGTYFRGTVMYAECYGGYEMIDKEERPMKTVWIDEITHAEYIDYDEARDAVLEHLDTDDYYNALEEVLSEHGIGELLKGLIHPDTGVRLYEKIMNAADQIVLRNFLVEVEVEEDEEDEEI